MLAPLKYLKLNKFTVSITNVDMVNKHLYFEPVNNLRLHVNKTIRFVYSGTVILCRYIFIESKNQHLFVGIANFDTYPFLVNETLDIYDSFKITKDNELTTLQDINDYYKNSTDFGFNIDNGEIVENYGSSKDSLLSVFDKHKLNNQSVVFKNSSLFSVNNQYSVVATIKVEEFKQYGLILTSENNELIDLKFYFDTPGSYLNTNITVNHCTFNTDKIKFRFTQMNYDSSIYCKIEIKTIDVVTIDFDSYLLLPNLKSLTPSIETLLSTIPITFNNGESEIIIDKYLASINFTNKKQFLTDAQLELLNSDKKFDSDIVVNLTGNKTLGQYISGSIIPAENKTVKEIITLLAQENIVPEVELTTSSTVKFNQQNISINLSFGYTIETLNAIIQSVKLEYKRNLLDAWTDIPILVTDIQLIHEFVDSIEFNTNTLQYRYTVTDSKGNSNSTIINIVPEAYVSPLISFNILALDLSLPNTNLKREIGNAESNLYCTITRRSQFVDLLTYRIDISTVNGVFVPLTSNIVLNASGDSVTLNDDTPLTNTWSLYKITIQDMYNVTTSTVLINFENIMFIGGSISELTTNDVRTLPNKFFILSDEEYIYNTGTTNTIHNIAIPTIKTVLEILDIDSNYAQLLDSFETRTLSITDANNTSINYTIYSLNNVIPYSKNHRFKIKIE